MDCNHGQELINLYIDQQLNQAEINELQKHLDLCETCRTDFELYKSIQTELMNTESVQLPDDFHETLMNRIKETPTKSKIKMVIKQFNIAAVFVFILVFSLIGINNLTQQKSSSEMTYTEATTSIATFETIDATQDSIMNDAPEIAGSSVAPEATVSEDEASLSISSNEEERHQKSIADVTPTLYGDASEATEEIPSLENNLKWLYPLGGGILLIILLLSYKFLKKD